MSITVTKLHIWRNTKPRNISTLSNLMLKGAWGYKLSSQGLADAVCTAINSRLVKIQRINLLPEYTQYYFK